MAKTNDICRDCLRWDQHGSDCWVHWEKKKDCSLRATTNEELQVPISAIR